jgi:hypothetical protein
MAIDDYFKHCESNGSIGNNYFTMWADANLKNNINKLILFKYLV